MIGQDDQNSAVVFASLNIVESFTNGFVVYIIMAQSYNQDPESLKFIIGWMPIFTGIGAYVISYWRFKNMADEFYKEGKVAPVKKVHMHWTNDNNFYPNIIFLCK